MLNYNTTHFKLFVLFNISFLILACSSETSETDNQEEFLNANDFSIEMNEIYGPATSNYIGTIEANTNAQQEIQFRLLNSNPTGAIEIDSNSGDINISERSYFDFEFFPVITAEVEVSVNDLVKVIEVIITLKDRVENNGFIYENEFYPINKIREFQTARRNDGKLKFDVLLVSPNIDFFNISGIQGQGEYIEFSFYAGDFHPGNEINEGVFNFDNGNNGVQDFINLNTDYDSDSPSQIVIMRKDILEAKIIYKRTDFGSEPIPQRKAFNFEIKFILYLTDGFTISGNFKGVGNSGYFTL